MERMREMSTAKERMHKEFQPSSVHHSLGQMGGPLSSPIGATGYAQNEAPRHSILDLASPSYNDRSQDNHQSRHQSYENSADERPIVSRYTEELSARGHNDAGHLNPYRSGQEKNFSSASRVDRTQTTKIHGLHTEGQAPVSSGGSRAMQDSTNGGEYAWKVDEGHVHVVKESSEASDEYSDDYDHYAEDSDEFESDSNDVNEGDYIERDNGNEACR